MTEKKERIAKIMAGAGLCSRRVAEEWILDGRVSVNGEKLTTPAFTVSQSDIITIDGKPIGTKQETRLWCYHKPTGLVTTHKDPQGRPTVFEKLPSYLPRVISVGRLDLNSEGLLLLTTDGELARRLEHPTMGWKRKYRVRIHGILTPEIQKKIEKGITIKGIKYAPCSIEVERTQGTNSWLQITLTEGKNREIRNIMAHFSLPVTRLIRISYGPFQLGNLEKGGVREVTKKALKELL
ncbi:MAG: rRNA pseudouridine synthase [Alphaproteobacteria bacterium]|nr:rRNA pseudouridine synthase [Alphaproteobacteria bacterium]MBQ3117233.1 rRNA pseudouridine synthase [Alphaproteobacteria bacterium]MBR3913595.1 rRNA pseudouridine synthase [Alphaproteobacteria bacterium]